MVEVEVVDKDGNRCPTALNIVDFRLEGKAEWKGGIGQGPDNYILSKRIPVECGVNRVLIRSTTSAGKIKISAASDGLKSAVVALRSRTFEQSGGLATEHPGDGLRSNLKRGPTPSTPSFIPSRVAIGIDKVSAGTNEAAGANSADDDETTSWTNGNQPDRGWIRYELQRQAMISEVTMKLGGWRSRTYPIRILVDDTEVFNARTERSLGYFTAKFPPAQGKTLTIELVGANTTGDGFNSIIEVTGKKLESTEEKTDINSLEIIEVEIYEAAANTTE
jgi:hypothetical protein